MTARSVFRCLVLTVALLTASPWALAHNGVVHGDHDARHGGFVTMYGDLHCEVVVKPSGVVQLYLSDAQRADLPAAVISDVNVEIERKGAKPEAVRMALSAGGDYWEGKSRPVTPLGTTVRAAFVFQREPVVMTLPGAAVMGGASKVATRPPAKATAPSRSDAARGAEHHGH